jgi:urease accessory protein
MAASNLSALLQLSDSALPIGGFAHSEGVAMLVAEGLLDDGISVVRLLAAHRRLTLVRGDSQFVRRAHRATVAVAPDELAAVAEAELSSRVALEQRSALLTIGSSLLRAARRIARPEELGTVEWAAGALGELTPRGSVFGATAAAFGVGEADAARAHVFSVLAGIAAAAVRLGWVAPLEAQAALRLALAEPGSAVASAEEADDWGLFSPLLDIAAMRHELVEPRLFAS